MKKSLVVLVVLAVSLGLVASVCAFPPGKFRPAPLVPAWAGCPLPVVNVPAPKPPKQIVKKEYIIKEIKGFKVICKGKKKGSFQTFAGCNAPAARWACKWSTGVEGSPVKAKYEVVKKATLVGVAK